jgi:hypothetical protein
MVYGILLESVVQCFILEKHDKILLQQIEEYTQCNTLSHINLFNLYDDHLMIAIAEGMIFIQPENNYLMKDKNKKGNSIKKIK